MARTVELPATEEPPLGGDWVLVTSEGCAGGANEGQAEQHESGATFFAPAREPDFSDAIERAMSWADFHGIATVYVQRGRLPLTDYGR